MQIIVYKLTRTDGLEYIGITNNLRDRYNAHAMSARFSIGIIETCILHECETYKEAEDLEPYYIEKFNTWKNGLNLTRDGKGLNGNCEFNTFGFKFSSLSRQKMSEAKIDYVPWNVGKTYKLNVDRTGKVFSKKFKEQTIIDILILYKTKPEISGVGDKSKNGKILSYNRAFANEFSKKFEMSNVALLNIITGKTIVWKEHYNTIISI